MRQLLLEASDQGFRLRSAIFTAPVAAQSATSIKLQRTKDKTEACQCRRFIDRSQQVFSLAKSGWLAQVVATLKN
jgi:hypothetical protein